MQTILPVELEVRCSRLSKSDIVPEKSGRAFLGALGTLDTSNISIVTLAVDDVDIGSAVLTVFGQAVQSFPALEIVTVRITGAGLEMLAETLGELHKACLGLDCRFRVDFLLDKNCDAFEWLAGNPEQESNDLWFSQSLIREQISVRWLVPAIEPLVFRMEGIFSVAREKGIVPLLIPPEIISVSTYRVEDLSPDAKLFLWDFITYRLLDSESHLLTAGQRAFYLSMAAHIEEAECISDPAIISVLEITESEHWQNSSESIPAADMRALSLATIEDVQDNVGWVSRAAKHALEILGVLFLGGRAHILRIMFGANRSGTSGSLEGEYAKALLIGAYGGEHIGDAAILGGVLLRMHEQFGTREAVLMTQRPNHTRHLVLMLDLPVNVTVECYERSQIKSHIDSVDCVVFAGGPLIDLPKQLVRHLYAVALAKRMHKPFIAEGIGPGPFVRLPSKFTARRLLEMADQISLRAGDAADHEVVRGLKFGIGLCPAFDYLKTRGKALSRLPEQETVAISNLLEGTDGRLLVGINIRPINALYTVGASESDVASYTRDIEERFERRFAEGLHKFSRESKKPPCFVFFPMNAIQFGSSDLLSAYRIGRLLGPDIDFRVWQADASLDGVVTLIRRLDIAITMRFHATIFAMSQNCSAIGIDYRIGKKDKIAGLMDDVGQSENCTRIDLMTGEWLANRLKSLAMSE